MIWYYSKNGIQLGPISQEELEKKIRSLEIGPNDLLWKEGMGDWRPLSRVEELREVSLSASVPPPQVTSVNDLNTGAFLPQHSLPPVQSGRPIPNYLWQSIVITALCCIPFGIPAIIYAARVNILQAQGNLVAAQAASRSAKKWCIVSLSCWLVVMVFYIIIAITTASNHGF